ncbi:hypothetical protein [Candidatus Nitrospira bockiana]
MMAPTRCPRRLWALAVVFLLATAAHAEEEKSGLSLRVDDLPKPIPQAMEKIKQVGNEAGKGISKAASEAAGAVNKAVKGQKPADKK